MACGSFGEGGGGDVEGVVVDGGAAWGGLVWGVMEGEGGRTGDSIVDVDEADALVARAGGVVGGRWGRHGEFGGVVSRVMSHGNFRGREFGRVAAVEIQWCGEIGEALRGTCIRHSRGHEPHIVSRLSAEHQRQGIPVSCCMICA